MKDGLDVDIDELKKLCSDPLVWKMEYEAQFADEFGAFIDPTLLVFSDPPATKVIASFAGFDVARTSDKSAIVMVDQLADGTYFVKDILVMSNMKYAD